MTLIPLNGVKPEQVIERSLAETVQVPPNVSKEGVISQFSIGGQRTTFLPPYGTRAREIALQNIYRMDELTLHRGSFVGIAKAIAELPWEIKGDESANEEDPVYGQMAQSRGWRLRRSTPVEYYQEVFRQGAFGMGWGTLISQGVLNYLRYDTGWFMEAIFAGESYDAPRGPLVGLANLDTLRCYPTGDPRYPAIYYDRYGGLHVMHHSRVIRAVDMLDTDDLRPGYGDCALSRSISVAMQEIWIQRYITARLDDNPAPGVSIVGGITKQEWDKTDQAYLSRVSNDQMPVWGKRKFLFASDMDHMPKMENYDFQTAPEKFDYRTYTDINVDRLALALGVDRQELMQLQGGGAIGSGAQSQILAQKARGKTIGFLIQEIERRFNDLLPDEFTFEFKYRDAQEALEDVQKAQMWAAAVATMTQLSPDEQRTLLASEIPAVQDAISSTPRGNDVFNTPMVAEDNTPGSAPVAPMQQPNVNVNEDIEDEVKSVEKNYFTTEAAFVQDVTDLLLTAAQGSPYLNRSAFGVTMRSLLKSYGTQAYKDGMAQGGVYVDALDPEDATASATVFVEQSRYINGLADDVFKTKTVTVNNAYFRAQMWGKSLQAFNDAGLLSADRNGMYRWDRGLTSDSCPTCLRMAGQVHRFGTWKARGILPKSSALKCKGFRCLCQLVRTTEKARGRF